MDAVALKEALPAIYTGSIATLDPEAACSALTVAAKGTCGDWRGNDGTAIQRNTLRSDSSRADGQVGPVMLDEVLSRRDRMMASLCQI